MYYVTSDHIHISAAPFIRIVVDKKWEIRHLFKLLYPNNLYGCGDT